MRAGVFFLILETVMGFFEVDGLFSSESVPSIALKLLVVLAFTPFNLRLPCLVNQLDLETLIMLESAASLSKIESRVGREELSDPIAFSSSVEFSSSIAS